MSQNSRKISILLNPPGNKKYFRDYYCSKISKANYYYHPIDLLYLSGRLNLISEVYLIDAIAENKNTEACLGEIKCINPDYIVFLSSAPSFVSDMKFISQLKRLLPNTKFIGSGDIFRESPSNILKKYKFIDALLFDFSTDDILIYLDSNQESAISNITYRVGDKIIEHNHLTQQKEHSIPIPLWHLFKTNKYSHPFAKHKNFASILTDFGCPYSCDFCPISTLDFKTRTIENVIEELDLLKTLGIRELYFRDQTFGVNKKRTHRLLNEMIKAKYNYRWSCLSRPDVLNIDTLQLMKKAGCHTIMLGIESDNTELLKKHKKDTSHVNLISAIRNIKNNKINTGGFFIIGFPEESEDSIQNTINLACSLNLDYASFNIASPRYGTDFRKTSISVGYINNELTICESSETIPAWKNQKVDNRRLLELKKQAVRRFYLRPNFIIKQIFKKRTIWEYKTIIQEAFFLLLKNK